ncbi:SulP family inorganic anion transporter [Longivirga aurantiaca]|uniref:SulP family inorganic anion transporter n=1 Tax=Longivirga aurantiaca TaxID=1837743 RepID=A0ABW1T6L2_9ACTN
MDRSRSVLMLAREHLGGRNLIAGLVVGAYLVPQAMAYGELAGVGASAGLTVALIPLLLYPLLGRTKWLSLGPESAVALMAAATVGPIAASLDLPVPQLLGIVSILTGAILLAARAAKAGFVTDLLSKPVLIGYLTGVALVMVISQVSRVLGDDVAADTIVVFVQDLLDGVDVNWWSLAIGLGTLGVILAFHTWLPSIPGTLVAIGLGVLAGYTLPVDTIGSFELAMPQIAWEPIPMSAISELLLAAAAIAVVAYTDVIVVARAFSDGDRVDANREMTALGVTDVVGGLFGGYPISASSSRTAIARMNGATSRFYSWIVAVVLIVSAVTLSSVLAYLPQATLGGIILYAAWTLYDRKGWESLWRLRFGEVVVAGACAAGVVVLGILPGIGIAVGLSVAELLLRLSRPHEGVLGFVPGIPGMHDVDDYADAEQVPGLVVYRYDSPLFFANSNDFFSQALEAADTPGCRWFLLNVEANVEVDSTGLDALAALHDELSSRGILFALARVKTDLRLPMERYGVAALIGEENMYATLPTAVAAYRAWAEAHPAVQPPPAAAPGSRDPKAHPRSTLAALGFHRFARVLKPRSENIR